MRAATRLTGPLSLITAYYGGLALAVWAISCWWPSLSAVMPFGGIAELSASGSGELRVLTSVGSAPLASIEGATLALAVAGAVLLIVPVSWVYFITTRKAEIDRSFAQTVVVLPVVVAGITAIVQHSLALAFALAGIVAAVRFRFTLTQPAHALYIFVAIVIGLSAGINAIGVGYITAVAFVLTNLALWRLNYGARLTTPFFAFLTGRGHDDNEL